MFKIAGEALVHKNITVIPSIHGRAVFALETRRRFLDQHFDCVAVELPPSLKTPVLDSIQELPDVYIMTYQEPEGDFVYVPIDPCDSIIEAVRLAERDRRCHLAFIDAEVANLSHSICAMPDEYAALRIGLPEYYQAVSKHLKPTPAHSQDAFREKLMAFRLQQLSKAHKRVLFVCGLQHVAGIERWLEFGVSEEPEDEAAPEFVVSRPASNEVLYHLLGELPYNAWLYNSVRQSITLEEYEPIFGLKNLLMSAREIYHRRYRDEIHKITPNALQQLLTYVRNLSLLQGYLTPSLYNLIVASKGVCGSAFALDVLEIARHYGKIDEQFLQSLNVDFDEDSRKTLSDFDLDEVLEATEGFDSSFGEDLKASTDEACKNQRPESGQEESFLNFNHDFGEQSEPHPWEQRPQWRPEPAAFGSVRNSDHIFEPIVFKSENRGQLNDKPIELKRRLVQPQKFYKNIKLEKRPDRLDRKKWRQAWDDRRAVSWPAEDEMIEGFADYVRKRALKMTAISMLRAEEFSASLMDGLHLKETLRNSHLNKIYVKVEPKVTGNVGAVVVIFEEDQEDGRFPWKITWYAEHDNESTLSFYATHFQNHLVGPGIAQALYGGAMFLYPPQSIPDVWLDPQLKSAGSSEERLLFGAAIHSEEKFVAYVAPKPPSKRMKEFCRRHNKKLIYLPLTSFSRATLWKMRTFHVLNGREVRSWAARYIR